MMTLTNCPPRMKDLLETMTDAFGKEEYSTDEMIEFAEDGVITCGWSIENETDPEEKARLEKIRDREIRDLEYLKGWADALDRFGLNLKI